MQKPPPKQARQSEKSPTPRKLRVVFSAIAMTVAALAVVSIGIGKKADPTLASPELRAAESTPLPGPDPLAVTAPALAPARDFLKRINASQTALNQIPAPAIETGPATTGPEPAALRLRREYKPLDEAAIAEMLAAKNIFDAERNPGGNFPHRFEIMNAAGLRLISDRATDLTWSRPQNPVKMNLKKSQEWIESLNRVAYGGIRNWRLPTIEEAASLLKKDGEKIFLDPIFGQGITVIWTGDAAAAADSWVVDFQNGVTDHAKNKSRLLTLMVSSGPD